MIAEEVVRGGRVLHLAGLSDFVWGHVSARDPAGRGIWMKAAGLGFDEVTTRDVLLVGWDGEVLAGEGARHAEYPIHTEIMRALPEVGSVVHVHPEHAIALAAAGRELQAFSHAGGVFARGVPRIEAPGLVDTPALGARLAEALGDRRALLLTGHGVVTAGRSVGLAVTAAVLLEQACRLQLLAREVRSSYNEVVYAHTHADEHLLGAWRYLARRVEGRERDG